MKTTSHALLLSVATFVSTAAHAGVTLVTASDGPEKHTTTMYLEGAKMRVDTGEKHSMVFDGDAQTMTEINHEKKTYMTMSRADMKKMMGEANDKMKEAMAKITPEQRAQMEAAMGKMDPATREKMKAMMDRQASAAAPAAKEAAPTYKWVDAGGKQTVAGLSCQGFKEFKNGDLEATGCYIPWSSSTMTRADFEPLTKMVKDFLSDMPMAGKGQDKLLAQFDKAPGFPGVWQHMSKSGEAAGKETLQSLKRGSVASSKFSAPEGYTAEKAPSFGAHGH